MKRGIIALTRDRWGVPRIRARTELEAIFAQGYAQAEDRLPTIMRAYRKAVGRMAEAFGTEWVEHDFKQRMFRHEAVAHARYPEIAPFYQRATEAFIAGIQRYMTENPASVPAWALDIEPYHVMALSRAAKWEYIIRQAYHDLGAVTGEATISGIGSNAWAIRPHLSAENAVILLSDPHLPWADEWLMHECHLQGGDLHVYGFQLPGLPYIQFGHNEYIAWGITSGGADVSDVYALTVNEGQQYFYEGVWRDFQVDILTIAVNIDGQINISSRPQLYAHYGPVIYGENGVMYAARTAYDDMLYDHVEALGELNKAKNVAGVREVLARRQFGPFNFIVGDSAGNIYFESTGRVPVRPAGYDWLQPLPGDSAVSEWQGWHETATLPQVLNPEAGWLQHCNAAPMHVTADSGFTTEHYPVYMLYGLHPVFEDGGNARSRYLSRRLQAVDKMTIEEVLGLALDCRMEGAIPWLNALFAAYEQHRESFVQLAPAIHILKAWDLEARQDRTGITLFWEWFLALPEEDELLRLWNRLLRDEVLGGDEQMTLLEALEEAAAYLQTQWGTLEVPWQQVYQMRRGDQLWPVEGCIGLTLRVAGGAWEPDEQGVYMPNFGQACPLVVILKAGAVRSFSALMSGESEVPGSPHFADQGQELLAQGKLKDTYFMEPLPESDVESRRTMEANEVQ